MAPVLVCPECGTKHPLNTVGPRSAFPCSGCGRTLKVPAGATAATTPVWPPPPTTPDRDPLATQMISTPAPPAGSATAIAPPLAAPLAAPPVSAPPVPLPSVPVSPVPVPPVSAADIPLVPIPAAVPPNGVLPDPVPGPPPGMPTSRARPGAPAPAPDFVPPRPVRFLLWIVAVPLAFFVVFGLARLFGVLSTNDVTDVALAEGWRRFMPIVRLLPFVALATAGLVHGGVYAIAEIRARRHRTAAGTKPPAARPQRGQASRTGA